MSRRSDKMRLFIEIYASFFDTSPLDDYYCRPMSERLPVLVNPKALAQKGAVLAGSLAIARMERLSVLLVHPLEDVNIRISFTNEGSHCDLKGKIVGYLLMECQRCLEPVELSIDHQIHLGIVESESEIDELQGTKELLLSDGAPVKLIEIIEDELLLLLPMYAMHEAGQCGNNLAIELKEPITSDCTKKKNPFEVLSRMQHKSKRNPSHGRTKE